MTAHSFDVTDMVSFNEKQGEIYYLATNGDPKQKHLFKYAIKNMLMSFIFWNSKLIIFQEKKSQN